MPKNRFKSVRSIAVLSAAAALSAGVAAPAPALASDAAGVGSASGAARLSSASGAAGLSSASGAALFAAPSVFASPVFASPVFASPGLASPVFASPVSSAKPADRGPGAKKLLKLLVDEDDLPRGYKTMGKPEVVDIDSAPGMSLCDQLRMTEPPNKTVKVPTAFAVFFKGPEGPSLVEMLSSPGARQARKDVDGVADAPRDCPVVHHGEPGDRKAPTTKVSKLRVPEIGDRASGVRMDMFDPVSKQHVVSTAILVAHGDVELVVSLAATSDDGQKALVKIAVAADRKLRKLR